MDVVAEAMPQDEVLVAAGDDTFLVHLTWSGRLEQPPWPIAEHADGAEELARLLEFRH